LTHAYYRQVQAGTFSTRDFLINRIARIYPLHLVTLVAAFIMVRTLRDSGWNIDLGLRSLVTNLFLVQSWGFYNTFSFNAPSWSISAEWFAYLVFTEIIALAIRPRPIIVLICALWFYGVMWYLTVKILGTPFNEFNVSFGIMRIMPEFGLGVSLYLFGRRRMLPIYGRAAIILCFAGLIAFAYMNVPDPVSIVVLGLLILMVAERSRQSGQGILDGRVPGYLGEISYAIYMVHFLVLFSLWSCRSSPHYDGMLILSFPMTVVFAILVHHTIEIPCRRIIRSYASVPKTA
jgi:peptidoglycan/LPS O-acetylase OafA/YrhL